VTPENIFNECNLILKSEEKYRDLKNQLSQIKCKLNTEGNPSKKAAEIIFAELNAIKTN